MKPPIVTIVISAWNSSLYVGQAIDSALKQQTNCLFEIVLVDDGSTDNSSDIYGRYSNPKFIFYLRPHFGQAATKNFAISKAKGGVVIILDSDDYLAPNAVEVVADYFKDNPSIKYAYSEHVGVSIDSCEIYRTNKIAYYQKNCSKYPEDLILHCCFHGHLMAMKKSIFDEVGKFNESLKVGIDYDWILRFCEKYNPGYIPAHLYYYREHGKGVNTLINTHPAYIEMIISDALKRRNIDKKVIFSGRDEVGYRTYSFS